MKKIAKELKLIYKEFLDEPDVEIDFNQLKDFLSEAKKESSEYLLPIEMSKIDIDTNNVLEQYVNLSKKKKSKVHLSNDIQELLWSFGFNMATYALRLGEQKYFTHGLIALGWASKVDIRDVLVILAAYWDVHKRRKLSFQTAIEQGNDFAEILQQFTARKEADKTLECMGIELVGEGQNIQYKYKNSKN